MLFPRDRKEANWTLFFSQEMLLACAIAAMKHRCCSSADADVAKIDFMRFNPGGAGSASGITHSKILHRAFIILHKMRPGGQTLESAERQSDVGQHLSNEPCYE
jgi:hypothetical protein